MKNHLMNSIGGDLVSSPPWEEVSDMIRHWSSCPDNGYLGSDYGYKTSLLSFLKEPQNDQVSRKIVEKMQADIPVLFGKDISLDWDNLIPEQLNVHVGNNLTVVLLDA